jgi:hypothetical protein
MACSDPSGLTTPTRTLVPGTSSLALNPVPGYPFPSSTVTTEPNETDGLVRLCKISNTAGTFTFDVQVNGGAISEVSITVGAGQVNTRVCAATALFNSDLPSAQVDQVLIVEDNPGAGVTTTVDIDQYFIQGITYHANALADQFNVAPRTARVFINDDMEKRVTFTNTTAPTGNQGCTPGFWKNNADKHDASQWGAIDPDATFTSVFGANDLPAGTTLLEALNLGGGGVNALARHAVAAYLNSQAGAPNYQYTTAQVISMVQTAMSSNNYDAAKDLFAAANESGCPLSQNN